MVTAAGFYFVGVCHVVSLVPLRFRRSLFLAPPRAVAWEVIPLNVNTTIAATFLAIIAASGCTAAHAVMMLLVACTRVTVAIVVVPATASLLPDVAPSRGGLDAGGGGRLVLPPF